MSEVDQTNAPGRSRRTRPACRTSLVADTDVAIGRRLGRDLLPEGLGVEVEYTGRAVLERVAEDRPDAVVLGSDLPDMTTLELIGRLDALSGPPLLVLLGANDPQIVEILDAGTAVELPAVPHFGYRLVASPHGRLLR